MKSGTDLEISAGMICRNMYFLRYKFCLKILSIFSSKGIETKIFLPCTSVLNTLTLWLAWGDKQEV